MGKRDSHGDTAARPPRAVQGDGLAETGRWPGRAGVPAGVCNGCAARGAPARAPRVVVDGSGCEAAVLVEYGEYVSLLAIVAGQLPPESLPSYWRDAIRDCIPIGRGWDRSRSAEPMAPSWRQRGAYPVESAARGMADCVGRAGVPCRAAAGDRSRGPGGDRALAQDR